MRRVVASGHQIIRVLLICVALAAAAVMPVGAAQAPEGTPPWFREGDAGCPRVALIFNIGIGETPSESILTTLVEQDVAATMFPMGSFARSQPGYLTRLDEAGFPIGTHGDRNVFLTQQPTAAIRKDIRDSVAAIEEVIGRPIDPWHTPYAGDTDLRVRAVVEAEGLLPVGWTVAAPDWGTDATEDAVYRRIMDNVSPGAVVEMHLDGPATEQSTALALPRIVQDLRAQGYEFVTIGEMQEPCDSGTRGASVPEMVVKLGVRSIDLRSMVGGPTADRPYE